MLNPQIFAQLHSVMGPRHVDLFASRLTRQLPRFFSWRPDPEAAAVDAFTQDWSKIRGYANPPWCLIPRCLTHIKRQRARVLLIAPLWKTQPWFPVLLDMLEDYPRILPMRPDLTLNPTGLEFIMNQVPTLVAWPICGIPSSQGAFRNQLLSYYSPPGGPKQHPTTTPCSTSGLAGVSRGIEIWPCRGCCKLPSRTSREGLPISLTELLPICHFVCSQTVGRRSYWPAPLGVSCPERRFQ